MTVLGDDRHLRQPLESLKSIGMVAWSANVDEFLVGGGTSFYS